ncbi:hypothetical protein B9N57_00475 [Finegoldia magna]|uniref:hypothetical protein n=1 Tax=Finegoldia magna TaxID=1260 RepID=UPI000B916FD3|nr:hypothetical protein [Finegoldia magna]OXZ31677.1 hypothetical protein B9N57_00475 [Finegoldia magna]
MKLKNIFKMLAIALLICLSVQSSSCAINEQYDPGLYNAAFDGMPIGIYNKKGVLVDPYSGTAIQERNTWIKFGDNTKKYEDIAGNMDKLNLYAIDALNYVRWINSDGTINKTKRYDDVKNRQKSGIIRFGIDKKAINHKDVIVILKNTETGETRKTVVPYGKKKERAIDYGEYTVDKIYQEGVNGKEFKLTIDLQDYFVNDTNHYYDVVIYIAENKEYKEEQKKKQEEEKKKKEEEKKRQEEEKKKAEEKRQKEEQLKKENEEKQKQYEEKLAQQKLKQEQQKAKQKRITIAVVVASVILIGAGIVLYKKRK